MLLLGALACDTHVGADPARLHIIDRLALDTLDAVARVYTHRDPTFPCVAILDNVAVLAADEKEWKRMPPTRKLAEDAHRLCSEGATQFAQLQVDRLQKAGRGRSELTNECFDLEHVLELAIRLRPTDPLVAELGDKRKTLCP